MTSSVTDSLISSLKINQLLHLLLKYSQSSHSTFFSTQNLCVLPTLYLCNAWVSEWRVTISLKCRNWLMFIIHTSCFICEARITFLSIVLMNCMFQVVSIHFFPVSDKLHRNCHTEWVSRSFRQLTTINSTAYLIPTPQRVHNCPSLLPSLYSLQQ